MVCLVWQAHTLPDVSEQLEIVSSSSCAASPGADVAGASPVPVQTWRDAASSANRADNNHTADYDTASMRQNEQAALACLDAWCELMSESQKVRISGSDDSARSITELAAYLRAGGALASAAHRRKPNDRWE